MGANDVPLSPLDLIEGHDWLAFAGIPAPKFQTISREQHFAEKIHAYTLPRETPNSRSRDLIDMRLLIEGKMDGARVKEALEATFKRRKTHPLPASLEPPPAAWAQPFARMAQDCGIPEDMGGAFEIVRRYFATLREDKG